MVKVNQKKNLMNSSQSVVSYDTVLMVLRSGPIIKKEYHDQQSKKNKKVVGEQERRRGVYDLSDSSAASKKKSAAQKAKSQALLSPPRIRRSNRKTSVYATRNLKNFGRKLVFA